MSFVTPAAPQAGTPTDGYYTYGPAITTGNVRAAVLNLLQDPVAGIAPYLGEIERQNSLAEGALDRPPSISSFRAGLDFETYSSDKFPMIIVVVTPTGIPEREGGGEYHQRFQVQVGALVSVLGNEQDAITKADCYGTAFAMSITQHGGLATNSDGSRLATNTIMMQFPQAAFIDSTGPRSMVRSVGTFSTLIAPVFAERYGPPLEQTPYAPGASTYPTVTIVGTEVTAYPIPTTTPDEPAPIE